MSTHHKCSARNVIRFKEHLNKNNLGDGDDIGDGSRKIEGKCKIEGNLVVLCYGPLEYSKPFSMY